MKTLSVRKTNAGVKAEGTWDEICNFLRDLESSLKDHMSKDSVERLDDWRPREDEDGDDMKKKTAEDASLKKRKVEEDCKDRKKELKEGGKEIARSVKDAKKNGQEAKKEFKNGAKKVAKAVGSKSLEEARKAEETIYEKIMLKLNPYYFDDDDFSINFRKKNNSDRYSIRVNANDDELRKHLKKSLGDGR